MSKSIRDFEKWTKKMSKIEKPKDFADFFFENTIRMSGFLREKLASNRDTINAAITEKITHSKWQQYLRFGLAQEVVQ
jgi:hypothetical protein